MEGPAGTAKSRPGSAGPLSRGRSLWPSTRHAGPSPVLSTFLGDPYSPTGLPAPGTPPPTPCLPSPESGKPVGGGERKRRRGPWSQSGDRLGNLWQVPESQTHLCGPTRPPHSRHRPGRHASSCRHTDVGRTFITAHVQQPRRDAARCPSPGERVQSAARPRRGTQSERRVRATAQAHPTTVPREVQIRKRQVHTAWFRLYKCLDTTSGVHTDRKQTGSRPGSATGEGGTTGP